MDIYGRSVGFNKLIHLRLRNQFTSCYFFIYNFFKEERYSSWIQDDNNTSVNGNVYDWLKGILGGNGDLNLIWDKQRKLVSVHVSHIDYATRLRNTLLSTCIVSQIYPNWNNFIVQGGWYELKDLLGNGEVLTDSSFIDQQIRIAPLHNHCVHWTRLTIHKDKQSISLSDGSLLVHRRKETYVPWLHDIIHTFDPDIIRVEDESFWQNELCALRPLFGRQFQPIEKDACFGRKLESCKSS